MSSFNLNAISPVDGRYSKQTELLSNYFSEKALIKYGSPVYVRHEIVHNKQVVEDLKKKGAIFINELSDIKDKTRPVVFSAHGVPKTVPEEAKIKKLS